MFTHPIILAQANTLASPTLNQSTGATFQSTVAGLMNVINSLVWLMGGIALVFFLYGIVRFVMNAGDTKAHSQGYKMMFWGLVALFVFFSIASIIGLMCGTLFGNTAQCTGFYYYTGGAPT